MWLMWRLRAGAAKPPSPMPRLIALATFGSCQLFRSGMICTAVELDRAIQNFLSKKIVARPGTVRNPRTHKPVCEHYE